MKNIAQLVALSILFLFVFLAEDAYVYAYIDPGTGSFIFQLIIGFLFTALFLIKTFSFKIKTFFYQIFSKKETKDEE